MPIAGLGAAPKRYAGPVSRLSVRPESRNHEFRDAATGIRHGIPPLWGFIHSGIGDLHALQKDRTEGPIQGEGSSFRSYWWVLASGGPWVCCVISGARKAAWADSLPARGLSSRPSRSRAPAKRCPAFWLLRRTALQDRHPGPRSRTALAATGHRRASEYSAPIRFCVPNRGVSLATYPPLATYPLLRLRARSRRARGVG
jgi:hypothetical protein